MSRGLFNLEGIEAMSEDTVLSVNINESSAEFGSNSPATNPTVTFDSNATGSKDSSISVPGGDKETPSAKPYDASSISIPGGDGETPHSKPYDANSVSIPAKTTLTADVYNSTMAALKKSFQEAVEVLSVLENSTVVEKSKEDLQKEYTESVLENALLESYENGPIFEAVERSDKKEVKKIVGSLRSKVGSFLKEDKISFYKPQLIIRALLAPDAALYQVWTTRLWQVLGIMNVESGVAKEIADKLTAEFKETLGDYKIIPAKAIPSLGDVFRTKFNWKNRNGAYFLIVDKKLPSDLKATQKEIADASNEGSAKKEEPKAEEKKED